MTVPPQSSILLASVDSDRLREWYVEAFNPHVSIDGFMQFGGVAIMIDERDDIARRPVELGRVILNFHVDDATATAAHLTELGVSWLAPLEPRGDGWFATLADADGNIVQIIELSIDYVERQRHDRDLRDG